jgi:zinc and cadmium transporter
VAHMSITWDIMHNLIDGLIIGSSYLVSIEVGIATTIAIILHEIPQELWDFWVLVHSGYSIRKALLVNFLTALTAIIGCAIAVIGSQYVAELPHLLTPFAAGIFLYIAGSDLIPELHKQETPTQSLIQIAMFVLGVWLMASLLWLEIGHSH